MGIVIACLGGLLAAAPPAAPAKKPPPPPPPQTVEAVPPPPPAPAAGPSAPARRLWLSAGPGPAVFFQGGTPALFTTLRAALELPLVADRLAFQAVLPFSLLYARPSFVGVTATAWGFSIVPAARLMAKLGERLRLWLDFGLGVAHYRATTPQVFVGYVTTANTAMQLTVSLGVEFRLSDSVALFAEPVNLHADAVGSTLGAWWSGLVGLSVLLPVGGGA